MPFCVADGWFVHENMHQWDAIRAERSSNVTNVFCSFLFFFPPPDTPTSPSGSDRKPRRFRLRSSRSGSKEEPPVEREAPYSPSHSHVIEQEVPSVFKEQFVPPDLSIWDYLITKVSPRVFIIHKLCLGVLNFNAASSKSNTHHTRNQLRFFFSFFFYICVLQPTLPPSENRTEYDSEDSQNCQDEEDDDDDYEDAFEANAPQKEHSNHNSYR